MNRSAVNAPELDLDLLHPVGIEVAQRVVNGVGVLVPLLRIDHVPDAEPSLVRGHEPTHAGGIVAGAEVVEAVGGAEGGGGFQVPFFAGEFIC
jgi:hypothetical protein